MKEFDIEKKRIDERIDKLVRTRGASQSILLDCRENGFDGFIETSRIRAQNFLRKGGEIKGFIQSELSYEDTKRFKTLEEGLEYFKQVEDEEYESRRALFASEDAKKTEKVEKEKRGRPTKSEKRDEKFRNAIEAGVRIGEKSISKIAWDFGHDKLKVYGGKLGHKELQVLDCTAYKIATNHYFGYTLGMWDKPNTKEPDRFIVIIPYSEFLRFINLRRNPSTKEVAEAFKNVAKITLEGEVDIPFCLAKGNWLKIKEYVDNICGVAIASESEEYAQYRSDRKLRGKGQGEEEPVFILLFSSPYGIAFFRNAMHREGAQLLATELYRLQPEAQVLFQSIRWKNDLIALNTKQISKTVGWVWPPKDFKDRIYRIRKLLELLFYNSFINKPKEEGDTWETKAWVFYTKKGRQGEKRDAINNFWPSG